MLGELFALMLVEELFLGSSSSKRWKARGLNPL